MPIILVYAHRRKLTHQNRLDFLNTFKSFDRVLETCFHKTLLPGYENVIEDFRVAYRALDISITTKVHLVFAHVGEYCKESGYGLGVVSEHVFESVHRDFLTHFDRHKMKDHTHRNFGKRLKKAMCEYNAGHL